MHMGADTREVILDKALELFHMKGYSATGVLDITRAAGVPKGSFYHFFESKEKLAVETVNRYAQTIQIELLDDPKVSPLQRIRDHIDHVIWMTAGDDYARGCLLGNFSTEMPSQSDAVTVAVAAQLSEWTHKLAETIAAAQQAGEIATRSDPERLAGFIVSGLEGALGRAKVSRSRAPLDGFRQSVFEDVLK
jgi:TetR/AcrR family transcriptional repressor of nem operon